MSEQTEAQGQEKPQGRKRPSREQILRRRRLQLKQQRLHAEKSQLLEAIGEAKAVTEAPEGAGTEVQNPVEQKQPETKPAEMSSEQKAPAQKNQEPRRFEQRGGNPRNSDRNSERNNTQYGDRNSERNTDARNNDRRNQQRKPAQREQNNEKISIVVPLYNEEESLRPLADAIKKAMSGYNNNYEVLFVDDGSTDRSAIVLRDLCRDERRFKFLSFQKNYGKSAALHVGFQAATGVFVVTMDADLQDDPAEIPNLIRRLREGYDMVSGWKKVRYDPFIKKYSSRFFNKVTGLMSGIKIHDFNCGLKAYKRDVVKSVSVYGEMHRYIPVLAKWQGFTVTEVAVKHHARKFGKTKFGISRFFKGFVDLLTVMFVTRFIKRPMHLFGMFGALSFILGFAVNGYLTVEWFLGKPLSNRPMLFLGMLLIIVGVQFFSIGLLGEMMVYNQQDNKEYRIKEKQLKN